MEFSLPTPVNGCWIRPPLLDPEERLLAVTKSPLACAFVLSFEYRLRIDRDVDHAADNDPAFVEDIIPADSEIVAVDPRVCEESGSHPRTLVDPFPPPPLPTKVLAIRRGS